AFTHVLRREQRLEDPLHHGSWDAGPVVAYGQLDEVPGDAPVAARAHQVRGSGLPDDDADGPGAVQRVASIDAKIEKHLLELAAVGNYQRGDFVERHLELQRR